MFTTCGLKLAFENYTRLAKGGLGMSSLWMAPDHLVYVKGTGFLLPFTEEYKRYRYEDIQCLSVARTSRTGKGLLYLAAALFAWGLAAIILAVNNGEDFSYTSVVFVSIFTIAGLASIGLLLRHWILGPTCICDIQTSVSRERLRPLSRLHQAKQAIEQFEFQAREAQASLVESDQSEGGNTEIRTAVSNIADSFSIPKLFLPTGLIFALSGLIAGMILHFESVMLVGLVFLLMFGGCFLLVLSLISSVKKATPPPIKVSLWTMLGLLFLFTGLGSIYYLVAASSNPGYTVGLLGPMEAFAAAGTDGGLAFYLLFLVLVIGFFGAGLTAVLQSLRWKERVARAQDNIGTVDTEGEENG